MIDENDRCGDDPRVARINLDAQSLEEVCIALNPLVVAILGLIEIMPMEESMMRMMLRTIGHGFYNDLITYILKVQLAEVATVNEEGKYIILN